MDMTTGFGIADHTADIDTVFDHRVALGKRAHGHLVAYRDVGLGSQPEVGIVLRDDAQHVGAGVQALDDHNADIVAPVMDQELW